MKYEVAAITHAANRILCEAIGDTTQPTWAEAPDWQRDSAVAGVAAIARGTVLSPEQSHESWLKQKLADGWVYGEAKDPGKKTHPCMLPYSQLPDAQKAKDRLFLLIANALTRAIDPERLSKWT